MARYSDQTVKRVSGVDVPLGGVLVYVYDRNENLATLTEDGGGDLLNPVVSDQYGNFHFNADDGLYQLQFHYGGRVIRVDERVMVGEGPELPDEIVAALIQPGMAAGIGYSPAGDDAEPSTVQAKLRETVSVADFSGVLSTTAAVQAALDYIGEHGGTLLYNAGSYALTAQTTLTPTTLKGIHIIGYGAEITTTGAISGLKIESAYWLPAQIVVEGLKISHRGNATATAGFELAHSNHVTFRNCEVEAHGTSASYGAFWFHHSDPTDIDAGCFWNTVEGCTIRPRDGGDGSVTYGVKLSGVCNATTVVHCAFSGVTTGVYMAPEAGQTAISNSVLIDDVKFENVTTAIHANGAAAAPIGGLRVTNCRAEDVDAFLSLTGSTSQPVVPPFLSGNYLTPNVTTYVNNPNTLYVDSLDCHPSGMDVATRGRFRLRNIAGTGSTLEAWASATDQSILDMRDSSGAVIGFLKWVSGVIIQLSGSLASTLNLITVRGISATTTAAANLRGTATFAAGTTVAVSFGTAEADASYFVQLTAQADPVGRLWVSGKGTGGFTINNSSSTSIAVDWLLVR